MAWNCEAGGFVNRYCQEHNSLFDTINLENNDKRAMLSDLFENHTKQFSKFINAIWEKRRHELMK